MVTGKSDQLYSNSWTDPQTNHEEAASEQRVPGGESSSYTRINGFSARQWLMYLSRCRFKVREDDTAKTSKQYLAKRRVPRHQAECYCFWINLANQLHDEVVLNRSSTTVWSRIEWTVWRWTRYQYVLRWAINHQWALLQNFFEPVEAIRHNFTPGNIPDFEVMANTKTKHSLRENFLSVYYLPICASRSHWLLYADDNLFCWTWST